VKSRKSARRRVDVSGMEPRHRGAPAYFITFHTYGTWLPGDPRGTVRRHQNVYGEPTHGRCDALLERSRELLQTLPVVLAPEERVVVLKAFEGVCRHRSWRLLAAHVRPNHVHVVVTADAPPGRIMGDLKAWATRRLVEAGCRSRTARVWVRQGSTRHPWQRTAVDAACFYVLHEQGETLLGTVSPAP
jgi:REP element-mobilizing transposase RayT